VLATRVPLFLSPWGQATPDEGGIEYGLAKPCQVMNTERTATWAAVTDVAAVSRCDDGADAGAESMEPVDNAVHGVGFEGDGLGHDA